MTKFNVQRDLSTTVLIVAGVLVLVLSCGGLACAEIYTNSAHGDTLDGINRSTATCENWPGGQCVVGSCAHCHDTFDPNICGDELNHPKMLFEANDSPASQTDNFCFQCHKGTGSVQVDGITNETYSTNFGGGTSTFTTIYDAFNPATGVTPSSHNLADVLDHAVDNLGFSSDTNACLVCHDQHGAQQNFPVTPIGLGVMTAIRRPIDYPSPGNPSNLWGDEDTELMYYHWNNNPGRYQQPYYEDQTGTKFEPSGTSTVTDGSDLPDYVTFCLDCHANPIGTLVAIDWSNSGNWHGSNPKDKTGMGYPIAPYTNDNRNYLLSCTDCHEPHGSPNEFLLRTSVNGKDGISVNFEGDWWEFCTACHVLTNGTTMYHRQRPPEYYPGCPECHIHDESYPNNNF
ncbi:MAG: cytochrome c3 family protein [Thermodesulfobacteriota bacterium]|nr:cytochrome c3 family protein [Thermodesulfobacteriota bacterium]